MSAQRGNGNDGVIRLDGARVAWREIDGEIVAVDRQTAEYLTMNGTGALIWEALADGSPEHVLVDRLVDEFSITPQRAGEDVAAFLRSLRDRGFVTDLA